MRKRSLIFIVLILVAALATILVLVKHSSNKTAAPSPQYISYTGNYTFKIPPNYSVDEKTLPNVQLVYPASEQLNVKTIDEAYSAGVISVQSLNLTDHTIDAFKKYVEGSFVADMKKISSDTKVNYTKNDKWDVAKVTTKKDGKVVRFAYLINDKHPVVIMGQNEPASVKSIEQSIIDIEDSGLNDEQKKVRQAIDNVLLYIKGQKAQDLYNNAATDLRSKNSLSDVTNALNSLGSHSKEPVTFYGTVYTPESAYVGLNFWTPNNHSAPSFFGNLVFKNENGKWKLQQLTLPTSPS